MTIEMWVILLIFSAFIVIYQRDIPVKVISCLTAFTALNGGLLQPTITHDLSVYPGRANYTAAIKVDTIAAGYRKEGELLMSKDECEASQAPRGKGSGIVRRQGGSPMIQIPIPYIAPGVSGGSISHIDSGGRVLTNVNVFLVFWGAVWAQNPTPSVGEITNCVTNIFSGPYMSALAQYGLLGPPRKFTTLSDSALKPFHHGQTRATNVPKMTRRDALALPSLQR